MTRIFEKYKKQCLITAILLTVILFTIYLWALFLPGLWHGDAFLYKQKDGTFAGSDFYAEYKMAVNPAVYGKNIDFSVNGKVKHYQIKYNENDLNRKVEISENGNVICRGKAIENDNGFFVIDDEKGLSNEISVRVGNESPSDEELYPNNSRLYEWAVSKKGDTRGEPYMLLFIFIIGVVMFLDIKFPNLFWLLEHRLEVDGGEPSDWYRFGQKVGYILLPIGIVVCMIITFTIH